MLKSSSMTNSAALPQRRKSKKYSFRAFYISTLLLCALALLSLATTQVSRYRNGDQYGVAQRRALAGLDGKRLHKRDEECRLVHFADDKCAFIKANCPDEEAGLFSYLSLYYCALPNAQPVAFTILVLWIGLLFTTIGIAASDFFCINLSTIATILGMSQSMAGVTFLAFGNGSPDVFSTFAAMSTHSGSMAIGELIGAAGFITAVVAGSMALVREFKVGKKSFVRDVGFFIVAASFSMVFLADGHLYLWECCAMIGFYLFYVTTVVTSHWYLQRQKTKKARIALSRGHYQGPSYAEIEVEEQADEDEDEDGGVGGAAMSQRSTEDFDALERGLIAGTEDNSDDEGGEGDRGRLLLTEVSNSMRVLRPRGSRRNTLTPIRPSLVGAMEFRSVLSSLQKARGSTARPIHLRRYSDDRRVISQPYEDVPTNLSTIPSDYGGSVIVTNADEPSESTESSENSSRARSASMNNASVNPSLNPAAFSVAEIPNIGLVGAEPTFPRSMKTATQDLLRTDSALGLPLGADGAPISPTISVTPPASIHASRDVSPAPPEHSNYENGLAPPLAGFPGARHLRGDFFQRAASVITNSSAPSPRSKTPERPRVEIPQSRESSQSRSPSPSPGGYGFPAYTDSPRPLHSPKTYSTSTSRQGSMMLPSPAIRSELFYVQDCMDTTEVKLVKWWPYKILPAPHVMRAALFPTFENWEGKNIWDKFLSVVSAPSIFMLAVTLPVVETEHKDDEEDLDVDGVSQGRSRSRSSTLRGMSGDAPFTVDESEPEWLAYRRNSVMRTPGSSSHPQHQKGLAGHGNTADVAVSTEDNHHHGHHSQPLPTPKNSNPAQGYSPPSETSSAPPPNDWNRWLVVVQIFTAPLFVSLILWGNIYDDDLEFKQLIKLVLYGLLGSLVTYAILILTTSHDKVPKYRYLLCFLGFVVSIAWISTIANEVVGVLKAFGVILGISDAILGLTIFAVGNSLGDLVADITVARLGYPVMALSACFGGPMLNILLGVGISGLYMTLTEANHKHAKHPGHKMKYKPYEIEISPTLLISGVSLLVTLVALLVVVPLNKWMMTRKIGFGLIALWGVSTVANLVVEITGVWDDKISL